MEEKKIFGNIDVKSMITIVALFLWVANTIYGFFNGDFKTVFDFFREVFMMIISFYLGSKVAKTEQTDEGDIGK